MMSTKRVLKVVCADPIKFWHKPGSWLIKKTEGTTFSHVAYTTEFNTVYEAVWPKCRFMYQVTWLKEYKIIKTYELYLDPKDYAKIINDISNQIGKPYSFIQCAMIYIAQQISCIKEKIESTNFNGWKALICSEFVARPLVDVIGYKFDQGIDSIGLDEIEECLNKISNRSY